MMPTPALDTHGNTHRLGGSCPTAPPLASPRRIVAQSQRKNPKSRRSKCPAARSYFNLRSAYVAKRVSLPLRVITGAPELGAKSP